MLQKLAILNKNQEEIARAPGLCEALSDNEIIFDDGQGHLIRGSGVFSLDELQNRVNDWGA